MKKSILYLLVVVFSFSIIACNNESNSNSDSDNQNNQENIVDEQTEMSPEELARITPADVDINKPIPVTDLYNSFFEWKDKEVTVAGYVKMYMDSDEIIASIDLIGEPGSYDILFECDFTDTLNQTVNKDDLVAIKGTITGSSFSRIRMKDCEIIGINEEYSEETELSPYRMPKEPVLAQNLFDVFHAWIGVEVSVIGYYNSTTTSTLSDNVICRIDLADPESGKKKVGCTMVSEPDNDYLKDNRNDVVIKGIVEEESFGKVALDQCVMVE